MSVLSIHDSASLFTIAPEVFHTPLRAMPLSELGITVYLAEITPEAAEVMLREKNTNRTLHLPQLRKLQHTLECNRWEINGETIIYDEYGRLIEGQHRLKAIVEAHQTVWTLVVHGINRERFKTMGQGAKRTAGDILGIRGEKDARMLAAALRWVYRYDNDLMNNPHPTITDDELADTITEHKELIESVAFGRKCHAVAAPGMCTALHYLCSKRNKAFANHFFWSLGTGENMTSDDPIMVLRERFYKSEKNARSNKLRVILRDEVKAPMIALTWNLLRKKPEARIKNAVPIAWHGRVGQKFPKLL